jgi:hypothetical protein
VRILRAQSVRHDKTQHSGFETATCVFSTAAHGLAAHVSRHAECAAVCSTRDSWMAPAVQGNRREWTPRHDKRLIWEWTSPRMHVDSPGYLSGMRCCQRRGQIHLGKLQEEPQWVSAVYVSGWQRTNLPIGRTGCHDLTVDGWPSMHGRRVPLEINTSRSAAMHHSAPPRRELSQRVPSALLAAVHRGDVTGAWPWSRD